MAGTCVGPGFVVNPDGTLAPNGPRAGTWPYTGAACTPAVANGLRLDAATGNLWVEPPDLRGTFGNQQTVTTPITVTTTPTAIPTGSVSIANADPCRTALVWGAAQLTVSGTINGSGTAGASDYFLVVGSVYLGTPPASPTGQPVLWNQNAANLNQVGAADTITVPFQYNLAAGAAAQNLGLAAWISGSGTVSSFTWTVAGVQMTTRTAW